MLHLERLSQASPTAGDGRIGMTSKSYHLTAHRSSRARSDTLSSERRRLAWPVSRYRDPSELAPQDRTHAVKTQRFSVGEPCDDRQSRLWRFGVMVERPRRPALTSVPTDNTLRPGLGRGFFLRTGPEGKNPAGGKPAGPRASSDLRASDKPAATVYLIRERQAVPSQLR